MPEWLEASLTHTIKLSYSELAIRLILSLVFGGVVAGIYALTQRRSRSDLVPMATTLVFLSVLIAMVTLIIGNNVARAFSLAGALAIIRFRTVVEDTRDTAFVIFAVVVGMGVGAGDDLVMVPLIGIPIVAAAAFLFRLIDRSVPITSNTADYSLVIRLSLGRDPNVVLKEILPRYLSSVKLRETTTARQGAALSLSYVVRLHREEEAVEFVTALNQVEGVQNVELRQV